VARQDNVSNKPDDAGVVIPPPLIYVAGFSIGLVLSRLYPLHAIPSRVAVPLGLLFLAAWIATWAGALPQFVRTKTPLSTRKPVTSLITSGIYNVTRNPLYVGWTFLYLAITVFTSAGWALIMLVPVAIVVDWLVVRKEEQYLERKFSDEYRDYKKRVRRWL